MVIDATADNVLLDLQELYYLQLVFLDPVILCKLGYSVGASTDYTDYYCNFFRNVLGAVGVNHVSALTDDAGTTGTTGIQTNAEEACYGTAN